MLTNSLMHLMTTDSHIVAFFSPGPQEMLIVGIIALLLFGKRLPEVARNLGKGLSEFKKGMNGFQDEIRSASRDVDRRIESSRTNTSTTAERPEAQDATENRDDFSAPRFDLD